ncbi:KRP95 [Symbiodinium pilosum]|uniref:KRP95 protein n=1 Tax=Symbiodinium pilosum TaxID=2952 RepID=A0A812S3D2_SYMPI|nr:KRP95 [Symbiodinium pilosum]
MVKCKGSERNTKLDGSLRLREATTIQLSLSALCNVISSLADERSVHIPYRDSKLTRLLQLSLGGPARTVFLANICQEAASFDESLSTLRYANRASKINNAPLAMVGYVPLH